MKNKIKSLRHLPHRWFLIGLLITLSLLWPLVAASYFSHHDDVQIIRLYQMAKCFADGQIPCRWVPDLGGEYGYPLFNYYAPLPYYWGAMVYVITGSLTWSAKSMFALSFIGAFGFMYLLGQRIWGSRGGFVAATLYSLAPYHAVDFYVRGAMGEMWALMFFPAILWAFWRLYQQVSITNIIWLAFMSAGLFLSHNLSAMIFLPAVAILLILLIIKPNIKKVLRHHARLIVGSALGMILGLLLAAFYVLPVLVEKDLVHVDTTIAGYFSYTEHFKGVKKLFYDIGWGYGASVREYPGSEKDDMSFQIGWVHLTAGLLAVIGLWQSRKKVSSDQLRVTIFCLGMIGLAIFMIHPLSVKVWQLLDPIKYLQFPWRFLSLIIFFISLLAGGIVYFGKPKLNYWIVPIIIVMTIWVNFNYFRPLTLYNISDQELLSGPKYIESIKRSIFDYLPKSAEAPPAELATSRYEVLSGDLEITNYSQGTDWFAFQADVHNKSQIRISQYYFPNWVIKVNGQPVEINSQNPLGLMTIILDPGQYHIEAELEDTVIRSISNIISGGTLLLLILVAIYQNGKVKRWFEYYVQGMNR